MITNDKRFIDIQKILAMSNVNTSDIIKINDLIIELSKEVQDLNQKYLNAVADYVEIDKYAVTSFNAIHNTNFEPQDICEWNKDIEVDLICGGFPCQEMNRSCYGFEIKKDFCNKAKEQMLNDNDKQLNIFEVGKNE